jgi:hypothetical protein
VQFAETGASFHPSVAAAIGSDALVVGYTRDYGTDTDVNYAYSTDGGATYIAGRSLPWTMSDEDSVDLAVSRSGGRFHAAYRHVNEIWYTCANVGTPTIWTSRIVVNDTGMASATYPLPSICTDPPALLAYEACVAWTDFRNPFYDAYFDRAFARSPGDLNCDGLVNAFDIDPFILALTDPAGYATRFPNCDILNADCNSDGLVNAFDIDPFIALLTGG